MTSQVSRTNKVINACLSLKCQHKRRQISALNKIFDRKTKEEIQRNHQCWTQLNQDSSPFITPQLRPCKQNRRHCLQVNQMKNIYSQKSILCDRHISLWGKHKIYSVGSFLWGKHKSNCIIFKQRLAPNWGNWK